MADYMRSKAAGVEVRVLKSETHNLPSQATQYALEDGKSLSDHVILQPNVVDVRFEMPNSNNGADQARSVFQEFIKMRDDRTAITLDTYHARYKNMVLVNITPVHQEPYRGALAFTIRLSQVGFIGLSDMVSATGGRSPGVLAGDGTAQTACAGISTGQMSPVIDPARISQCSSVLAAQSSGRAA